MRFKALLFSMTQFAVGLFGQERPLSSDKVIQLLMEGNQRYITDNLEHPNRTIERREALSNKQRPFAIILGCSDSRVSPEIIFDQGVGDLFVVRVAGNVVGPIVLDSIEYAALYLDATVILVLGHENCGAVNAVIDNNIADIEDIARLIQPAVKEARLIPGNLVENATKENVRHVVDQLKKTKVIASLIKQDKMKVVGGYYNFASGKVEFLTETK